MNDKTPPSGQCPFLHGSLTRSKSSETRNQDWWSNQLNLKILHQNDQKSNPLDSHFNYADAFLSLNLDDVKQTIKHALTDSQDW